MRRIVQARTGFGWQTVVCVAVFLVVAGSAWAQDNQDKQPTTGCSLKGVADTVTQVMGSYDNSMQNGGTLPGVSVEMKACSFRRVSSKDVLQVTLQRFGSSQGAARAFQLAIKSKDTDGPYYTSDLQKDGVLMRVGPGRLAAQQANELVLVHWMVAEPPRFHRKDVPGEKLALIALAVLHATQH